MEWALFLGGYLLGSVPFGVLLTRWFHHPDPRQSGSGNIGATNVARVAGKKLGAAVLLLDAGKGAAAVAAALHLFPQAPWVHAGVGLSAFLGHLFPVWLRFRGGKGVATALGVFAVLLPPSALIGLVGFLTLFALTRLSSVGSLAGTAAAAVSSFFWEGPREYCWLAGGLWVLMLYTHRENLKRLRRRAEPGI
jgi:glycerol-3-phosphate acyltransferase PlsY